MRISSHDVYEVLLSAGNPQDLNDDTFKRVVLEFFSAIIDAVTLHNAALDEDAVVKLHTPQEHGLDLFFETVFGNTDHLDAALNDLAQASKNYVPSFIESVNLAFYSNNPGAFKKSELDCLKAWSEDARFKMLTNYFYFLASNVKGQKFYNHFRFKYLENNSELSTVFLPKVFSLVKVLMFDFLGVGPYGYDFYSKMSFSSSFALFEEMDAQANDHLPQVYDFLSPSQSIGDITLREVKENGLDKIGLPLPELALADGIAHELILKIENDPKQRAKVFIQNLCSLLELDRGDPNTDELKKKIAHDIPETIHTLLFKTAFSGMAHIAQANQDEWIKNFLLTLISTLDELSSENLSPETNNLINAVYKGGSDELKSKHLKFLLHDMTIFKSLKQMIAGLIISKKEQSIHKSALNAIIDLFNQQINLQNTKIPISKIKIINWLRLKKIKEQELKFINLLRIGLASQKNLPDEFQDLSSHSVAGTILVELIDQVDVYEFNHTQDQQRPLLRATTDLYKACVAAHQEREERAKDPEGNDLRDSFKAKSEELEDKRTVENQKKYQAARAGNKNKNAPLATQPTKSKRQRRRERVGKFFKCLGLGIVLVGGLAIIGAAVAASHGTLLPIAIPLATKFSVAIGGAIAATGAVGLGLMNGKIRKKLKAVFGRQSIDLPTPGAGVKPANPKKSHTNQQQPVPVQNAPSPSNGAVVEPAAAVDSGLRVAYNLNAPPSASLTRSKSFPLLAGLQDEVAPVQVQGDQAAAAALTNQHSPATFASLRRVKSLSDLLASEKIAITDLRSQTPTTTM